MPVELLAHALQEPRLAQRLPLVSVQKVMWKEETPWFLASSMSPAASISRVWSSSAPGRTMRRGPETGVKGTEICSFG